MNRPFITELSRGGVGGGETQKGSQVTRSLKTSSEDPVPSFPVEMIAERRFF